jgi:hypothetical protein
MSCATCLRQLHEFATCNWIVVANDNYKTQKNSLVIAFTFYGHFKQKDFWLTLFKEDTILDIVIRAISLQLKNVM